MMGLTVLGEYMEIHKHHIIPKHMGGSDEEDNLVYLTREEHAAAHLKLYEECGKKEDLCAYYMLSFEMEKFRKEYAHLGGVANLESLKGRGYSSLFESLPKDIQDFIRDHIRGQGLKYRLENPTFSVENMSKVQASLTREQLSDNGKKGAEVCRDLEVNAFFDPELRQGISSKGGKVQGKRNVLSGHLASISKMSIQENRRNLGKRWVTDGETNSMIDGTAPLPEGFRYGMSQKSKEKVGKWS